MLKKHKKNNPQTVKDAKYFSTFSRIPQIISYFGKVLVLLHKKLLANSWVIDRGHIITTSAMIMIVRLDSIW